MLKDRYDVIVVGGGLAGLACGLELVRAKFDVLIVEKKQAIGTPVRCGELTSPDFFKVVGLDSLQSTIENDFGSMVLISRSRFEIGLADEFVGHGGTLYTKSWVRGYIPFDGKVVGVSVETGGEKRDIRSRVVVACDGVEATVPRKAGLANHLDPSEIGSCYSAKLEGIRVDPSQFTMGYNFGKDFYFYWIFPSSNNSANVGVGLLGVSGNRARRLFFDFIGRFPHLRQGSIVREIVGAVPITRPLQKPYGDGLLVAGTAARLVNADGGEGIIYALQSGVAAAQTIAETKDYSSNGLSAYRQRLSLMYENLERRYQNLVARFPPGLVKPLTGQQ